VEQSGEKGSAGAPPAAVGALADGPARVGAADGASAAAPEAGALPDKMRFFPQRWAKVYDNWMNNIQDWCISRQLWWGDRIPVWTGTTEQCCSVENGKMLQYLLVHDDGGGYSASGKPGHKSDFFLGGTDKEIIALTDSPEEAAAFGKLGLVQDPDVLDTWFSSWLWPFATMGWTGDKSQDSKNPTLQAFYPTTDLVTAP